jgi:hypothetical protein
MADDPVSLAAVGSDRIERQPGELRLICAHSKGWNARRPGAQTRAAHPGTAVSWAGRLFEVVGEDPSPDGGVSYRLAAWPEEQAIRTMEAYDDASERLRAARRAEEVRDSRRLGLSILLAPVAGFLPGAIQRRMEREFSAPARAMTITSGLIELAVGVVAWLNALAASLGGATSGPSLPLPLSVYLITESAVRIGSAWVMERPMGTILTEIPWALFRRARDGPGESAVPPLEIRRRDRFHMLEAVLALLSEAEQVRLRREFSFDPILWGRRTAAVLWIVGGANASVALLNLLVAHSGAVDLAWLLAGSALVLEQAARLRRLREGRPAGSVLGALVRPLARPLFAPTLPASPA